MGKNQLRQKKLIDEMFKDAPCNEALKSRIRLALSKEWKAGYNARSYGVVKRVMKAHGE